MHYLPIALDVRKRACLVVGGGQVALRKIEWLSSAGAELRVVAKVACAELHALARAGALVLHEREYCDADLDGCTLVVAATDDRALNARISEAARSRALLVNVVDQPELCTFIVPALVTREPMVIGISSQGSSPVLARLVRRRIESVLPPALGALASFARRHRARVRAAIADATTRRTFWERVLDGPIGEQVLRGEEDAADAALAAALCLDPARYTLEHALALLALPEHGLDALTLGAMRALGAADVVLHDGSARQAVALFARRDARRRELEDADGDEIGALLAATKRHERIAAAGSAAWITAVEIQCERLHLRFLRVP
jgi:uroporphyrin-III C-methyltransferase/precorrin-2 dehydrogenase/sirohydrochlorin ferrochelatase